MKALQVMIGVTYKFLQVEEFANTESTSNEINSIYQL